MTYGGKDFNRKKNTDGELDRTSTLNRTKGSAGNKYSQNYNSV